LNNQGTSPTEQPFVTPTRIVICDGSIYNAADIIAKCKLVLPPGASSNAIIPALLDQGLTLGQVARCLDGDFAIAVIDLELGQIQVTRDPFGVRPLVWCQTDSAYAIASEIKAFSIIGTTYNVIRPGVIYTFNLTTNDVSTDRWYQVPWVKEYDILPQALQDKLITAVTKRMTSQNNVGVYLSSDIESSVIAAIAARILARRNQTLNTYSIGVIGSKDLINARRVAEFIGSHHHQQIIAPSDCIAVIPHVVRALESYDINTIRYAVNKFLLAEFIKHITPNVNIILNSDGANEVLGGYLYMRTASNDVTWEIETDRLLREIHRFDVLGSERSMISCGIESRTPYLDREFISTARSIKSEFLRSSAGIIEKTILRNLFADWLPKETLTIRSELFNNDESWFVLASAKGESVADQNYTNGFTDASSIYNINPPTTFEALWYRVLFNDWYPEAADILTPYMWVPNFVTPTDQPARILSLAYN
jgi:asparagine synthase (glutamine-hydrolysing)